MKMLKTVALVVCTLLAATALGADATRLLRKANRYFEPLPASMPGAERDTPARVALGQTLFFDPRLSVNDRQSCSTCHLLGEKNAGVDNLPTSPGARGETGSRNTPTVLNAGWQFAQFWDGRAEDLVEQAKQPILNPIEMGMPDEAAVVAKLEGIPEYAAAFAEAFPDNDPPLSYQNLAEAIAAFERTLRTRDRFDDFLQGNTAALSDAELRGLGLFIGVGCTSCHDGPLLGGTLYKKLGEYGDYANQEDTGRMEVTGAEDDRLVFKVSQLRNVALTEPYFHDGRVATLEEAVRLMALLQNNRKLDDAEVADLVSFLGALSGKVPAVN